MKIYIVTISLLFSIFNIYSQKVIFMNYENGVYIVPCKVNTIPMNFVFDTGASDVSISITEANFLYKQGLLTENDIIGNIKYQIADGNIKNGTKIILREINISGLIIKNVTASIVHEQNAPLLFGQSIISKFKKIYIENNKLVIFPKDNKNDYIFLNVDLTKNYIDFGYDISDLQKDFNPISFSKLKINKNNFLSDLEFTRKDVIFNRKGKIVFIILRKKSFDDKLLNSFYEKIISNILNEYGNYKSKNERLTEWENENIKIAINKSNENTVDLVFINQYIGLKNKIDELLDPDSEKPKNIRNNSVSNDTHIKKDIKKLHNELTKYLNLNFENRNKNQDFLKQNSVIENNKLFIVNKINMSEENDIASSELKVFINHFCYKEIERIFGNRKMLNVIDTSKLESINFKIIMLLKSKSIRVNKKLNINELLKIGIPFTKFEIINILK